MAFGGSQEDLQLVVDLVIQQAVQAIEAFKQGFIDSMQTATKEVDKVEKAVDNAGKECKKAALEVSKIAEAFKNPTQAAKDFVKVLAETNPQVAKLAGNLKTLATNLAPIAPYAIGGAIALGGLFLAYKGITSLAAKGDAFGDISDAFEKNAEKAGVLADTLRNDLSAALNDTVANIELMSLANEAFAKGLDPKQFDDLAAAAKRYADATGGDATQALQQLIAGVSSGREELLKKFGTVKDGVLIIDEFNAAEARAAQGQGTVTDTVEQYRAALRNTLDELRKTINESTSLNLLMKALAATFNGIVTVIAEAVKGFLFLADGALAIVKREIDNIINGFAVLGKLFVQMSKRQLPDVQKAARDVAKELNVVNTPGKKAGDVLVKLGGASGEAVKKLKELKKAVAEAFEASDVDLQQMLGFEAFSLGSTGGSLQDALKKAFKQIDPNAILASLKGVREAFLDGITGTPEEFAEETKKRLAIFKSEFDKVKQQLESPNQTAINKLELEKEATKRLEGLNGIGPKLFEGIFGDGSEGSVAMSNVLGAAVQSSLAAAFDTGIDGFTREDAPQLGQAFGGAIGAILGASFTGGSPEGAALGAQIGGTLGTLVGMAIEGIGGDTAGTRNRKEIDAYFAELFDAERVSAVINGQLTRINDLVFEGNSAFGGSSSFGGAGFFDVLNAAGQQAAAGITGLGVAFGELNGIAEEQSRLIGAALANNVGTSLENLRALVKATGESFETLSDAILQAFYDGMLTIEEFYEGMKKLEDIFSVGFPDAVGDVTRAVENLQAAMQDGRGSRQLFDSIRDAAQEAAEVGQGFDTLVAQLGSALGLTAQQAVVLMEFLKKKGIDTAQELRDASISELLALLEAARRIVGAGADLAAGADAANQVTVPTDPTANTEQPGLFNRGGVRPSSGSRSSGSNAAANAAKERERELKRQREELYKLLTASEQYENILGAINAGTITNIEASKQIRELYGDIKDATQDLEKAEKAYKKALEDRGKSQKQVAKLAKELEDAQKRVDELTDRAEKANVVPKFDISGAIKLTQTVNELAVIAKAAGVNLQGLTNTLVEGFLRGRTSITDFRTELEKLEDTFGDGIPKAVGDVQAAINNLREGGKNGGLFSVDAFKDIFAEFEELFGASSSEKRKKQFAQLTKEFDESRDALDRAISTGESPEAVEKLRKRFEGAKKALQDFSSTPAKAGLEDLRDEISKTLSPQQVEAFFGALRENNITTFEQVKQAGPEAIARILASLDELGFGFGETSDRVKAIIKSLDDATIAQTNGKDVLGESLNLIGQFNEAVDKLPAAFDAAGVSIDESMNGPLATMAFQVSDLLNKLESLSTREFNADVVLNVRAEGENGALGLVDVLFGDGSGLTGGTGGSGPGLSATEEAEYQSLLRARKRGALSAGDRARFEALRARRNGRI